MAHATVRGMEPRGRGDGMTSCFRANFNLYLALARQSASGGDVERAYLAYRDCLQTLRRANLLTRGQWREEESEVRRELTDFLLGSGPESGLVTADQRLPLEC